MLLKPVSRYICPNLELPGFCCGAFPIRSRIWGVEVTRKGSIFSCPTWQDPPETTSPETWRGSDLGNTKKGRILGFFQHRQVERFFRSLRGLALTAGLLLEVSRMEKKELFQKCL